MKEHNTRVMVVFYSPSRNKGLVSDAHGTPKLIPFLKGSVRKNLDSYLFYL